MLIRCFFLACLLIITFHYFSLNLLNAKNDFLLLPGEKIEYELSWGFIPVGSAVMEVAPRNPLSIDPWQIRFSVRTNSFADKFYKVRTNVTSWVDSNFKSFD